ncbi:MAG: hypothetical protein BroJett022_01060 [Actinomycetes bacterium]|nr:MAG: hypothetical protein BroJett022_01060 [Actinomycetes bacterium]
MISSAETGRRFAIRKEIRESWRISFSVSLATVRRIDAAVGPAAAASPGFAQFALSGAALVTQSDGPII